MNVDELRRSLEDSATGLADAGASARVAGVHQKVTTIRRRRRAVVAAGVAAVLVAGGVTVGMLTRPDAGPAPVDTPMSYGPTPGTIAQWKVEPDGDVADWTYVRGVESDPGDESLTLTLPDDDHDRAVTFLSTIWDSTLTLSLDGTVIRREDTLPQSYAAYVGPGPHELVLRGKDVRKRDVLGMAVFRRPDTTDPQLASHGGGWTLLTSAYGEESVDLTFTVPDGPFALMGECWPGSISADGNLYLNDTEYYGSSCASYPSDLPVPPVNIWEVDAEQMERYGMVPGEEFTLHAKIENHFPVGDTLYHRTERAEFASSAHHLAVGVYVKDAS